MADFSHLSATEDAPPFLANYSRFGGVMTAHLVVGPIAAATTTWNTANQARYYPMSLPFPYVVRRVWWLNGSTASNNRDFGVYSASGKLLVSSGSTAASGASSIQFVDVTDTYLSPGDYWFAFNCDSALANRIWGHATGFEIQRQAGIMQEASAFPLPATATFGTPTVNGIGLCGVTNQASGF